MKAVPDLVGGATLLTRKDIHNSEIPELCRSCEARHKGVCGALSAEQLIALAQDTTRKVVPAGTELIASEERVSTYANVMSGVVKLSKPMADGRQQIVGLQFAPDFLGRPFKENGQVNAEAATTVTLCSFPKRTLDRMLKEAPKLEHKLLEQALDELDEAREWMVTLGQKSSAEKVASYLLLIATSIDPETDLGRGGPVSFDLPMSRADIADFLGLTIETTSRRITRLRRDGVIEIERNRRVTVPDLDRLRHASGE